MQKTKELKEGRESLQRKLEGLCFMAEKGKERQEKILNEVKAFEKKYKQSEDYYTLEWKLEDLKREVEFIKGFCKRNLKYLQKGIPIYINGFF